MKQNFFRLSQKYAAAIRQLKQESACRKFAEKSLKLGERHHGKLLEQSRQMQDQLRLLSRQLLSAQEEERKKISRELHDVTSVTLTGINVQLTALKGGQTGGTGAETSRASQFVQQSVEIVHQFSRELRPAVLDDLGLIPALHTFMKSFREQTGIRVSLAAFAEVEQLHNDKRIVLYRVAQEALTNVGRHAQATRADVEIQKMDEAICMSIRDNGKGFRKSSCARQKEPRPYSLGMRERLEMVGGSLEVSTPGRGTIVKALIPFANNARLNGKHSRGGTKHQEP